MSNKESKKKLSVFDLAPNFTLVRDGGEKVSLSDFRGKKVLLYFYPKDRTLGCTYEACTFRNSIAYFEKKNIVVLGISRDSIESHDRFKHKHHLNFPLLSDIDGEVSELYGVTTQKPLFGLKLFEVIRSTFLIDETGHIAKIWRNVNALTHVKKLIKEL